MVTVTVARVRVASDAAAPREVRRWLEQQLACAGAVGRVVDDLRLIASELCSNAIEHVDATSIVITLDASRPEWWIVTFTSETLDGSPPHASTWRVASPDAVSGRGLGIVRSLSDHVTVEATDSTVTITCWRRRGDGTAPFD